MSKKKSPMLFPDDSDGDDGPSTSAGFTRSPQKSSNGKQNGGGFQINKNYAERYDNWRNQEEQMKLKARLGTSNPDDSDDSDSSSSDDLDDWTEEKEKDFFKALSNLKKKDPKIYDPSIKFFHETEQTGAENPEIAPQDKKKKKDKPFLLKDHERTMILEKGGLLSEDEDDDSNKKQESLPYYRKLDSIRKEFNEALKDEDDDSDNEGFLNKGKPKNAEEEKQEQEDYRKWLKGELERLGSGKISKEEQKELGFLRSYWNDDKLDEGEKFLRDYILNKGYKEPEVKTEAPYSDNEEDNRPSFKDEDLSEDENFENARETFEHKYNFRFEEPDPEFIKRYPRIIEDSLRREDDRRKTQRASRKERKKDEKDRKRDEVQRLKALKRKEIMNKLKTLQEIAGLDDDEKEIDLEALDLDGDFDPSEYDRRMEKVFGENYHGEGEDAGKPVFPYDPEIDDEVNWEEWAPATDDDGNDETSTKPSKKSKRKKKNSAEGDEEEPSSSKSKKALPSLEEEMIGASTSKKKGKKVSKFLEVLEKPKPKFNPDMHKTFKEYFEEYYALDFEDLVGDLPTRFKYRKVVPNDFGLTTKEILKADDKELNSWASLKKTYQYRADDEEKYEAQAYQKKAQNENLKKKLLTSIYQTDKDKANAEDNSESEGETELTKTTEGNEEEASDKKSKRKRKKNKKRGRGRTDDVAVEIPEEDVPEVMENGGQVVEEKKSKKKKNKNSTEVEEMAAIATVEMPTEKKDKKSSKSSNKNKSQKRKNQDESVDVEDDRLAAYGLNPKKFKKWKKYGNK